MYKIYLDGKPLYSPNLFREGYGVFSPKLTVELNKAGSLDFTIPPVNVQYDNLKRLKSIVTVYQDDTRVFRGRILNDEKDFYKQKKVFCEGELAFFLDSQVRPYSFEGKVKDLFKKYINDHNSRVDSNKQFTVGEITVSSAEDDTYFENTSYKDTLSEINDNLIDYYGGFLKVREINGTRYIDWLADSGNLSTQTIEFGVNLLDLSEYVTAENIITVLIPVGASLTDEEGNTTGKLDITSVNDGKDYIENEAAIALFGRIEGSEEWSDVEDANELLELGRQTLDLNLEMSITLTVKAVDLHLVNVNVDMILLGDWVRVISLPHNIDKEFQCTKIVYDMVDPGNTEYTFGITYSSLTDRQVNGEKSVKSSVTNVQSVIKAATTSSIKASAAAKNVETVIAQMDTEYVKTTTLSSYQTEVNNMFESQNEDIDELETKYNELLERVSNLEGGTA